MKVLAGTSNSKLCKDIARQLKLKLVNSNIIRFADGEVYIEINENIRGNSIFVVQSTSNPANDNLMELLICIDALRRSSAKNITAVIPYFGYARQDRKVVPRTAISAKLVSNLITNAGANRILSVDLHAGQIQGFFDIPVDNLFATPIFARHIKNKMKLKRYILSVVGNKIIKFVLGINCDDFTSAYRGFNLDMLKNYDINGVSSRGYSFFMETIFELDQRNVPIDEIPITFNERKHGVSKIPQIEIFRTLKNIFKLFFRKILKSKKNK